MRTFREIAEAIKSLSDTRMDQELKNRDVMTFAYNAEAIMELAKIVTIYETKDKSFFHFSRPKGKTEQKVIQKKLDRFNLKEI